MHNEFYRVINTFEKKKIIVLESANIKCNSVVNVHYFTWLGERISTHS